MHSGGFSHRRVADHFRVNHSIIVRLMQRFRQTGNVTDRPRAGRPRKTTPRENTNRKWNLKLYTQKISFRSQTQMLKSTRGTLHTLSYTHK
jgi:transposase